jgi:hypothetical protein
LIEFLQAVIFSGISRETAGNLLVGMALAILGVVASTFAAAGRYPGFLYRLFGLPRTLYKPFPLSSYAVLALSLLMFLCVVALGAALIFSDFLPNMASEMGYSSYT